MHLIPTRKQLLKKSEYNRNIKKENFTNEDHTFLDLEPKINEGTSKMKSENPIEAKDNSCFESFINEGNFRTESQSSMKLCSLFNK